MFSNQAVLSACLITLLGLVSTRLILHKQNNPMVLSFTPTSHVNATAVDTIRRIIFPRERSDAKIVNCNTI